MIDDLASVAWPALAGGLVAGTCLGGMFFGGLWLTVRHLPDARRPALRLLGSLLLRFALALAGFLWLVRHGGAAVGLAGAAGFLPRPLVDHAVPAVAWTGRGVAIMTISPDTLVFWEWGPVAVNATLVFTWLVMALLTFVAWLASRRLSDTATLSRWQNLLEILVTGINDQIRQISRQEPGPYLPFVGTLFLFIAVANLLNVVPGYLAPTGSLSTTTALAICVFVAVPLYGIAQEGARGYLRHYLRPSWLMLPFNVVGELSRTVALAVRLYGNIMSGTVIVAILLSLTPYFFPVVMQLLGLLTGMIQAYIFAVLAMVYIASASSAHQDRTSPPSD